MSIKLTESRLRQIIREEINQLNEFFGMFQDKQDKEVVKSFIDKHSVLQELPDKKTQKLKDGSTPREAIEKVAFDLARSSKDMNKKNPKTAMNTYKAIRDSILKTPLCKSIGCEAGYIDKIVKNAHAIIGDGKN